MVPQRSKSGHAKQTNSKKMWVMKAARVSITASTSEVPTSYSVRRALNEIGRKFTSSTGPPITSSTPRALTHRDNPSRLLTSDGTPSRAAESHWDSQSAIFGPEVREHGNARSASLIQGLGYESAHGDGPSRRCGSFWFHILRNVEEKLVIRWDIDVLC